MAKRPARKQTVTRKGALLKEPARKPTRTRKTQTLPAPPAAVAQPHPWLDTAKNVGFVGALLAGLAGAVWGGLQHPGKAPDNSQNVATPVGTPPVPPIVEMQPEKPQIKFEIPKAEVEKEPVVTPQTLPPPPALDSGPGRKRRH